MSLPTSRFSDLAISGMLSTSNSTDRNTPAKDDPISSSDEYSGSEQDSADDSDTSASGILTSVNTKLRYNSSRLTPTISSRARAGLNSPFTFTACSFYHQKPSPPYYGVQISETSNFHMRVGSSGSEYSALTCTCGEQRPCRHVFFLLDQIANHTLDKEQKKTALPLTQDGVQRDVLSAFQTIKDSGDGLFEKLKGKSRTVSGKDDDSVPQRNPGNVAERINDVRDILASFSPTESTDEFRPDIFDNIQRQGPPQNQLFPDDLEKTLALSMIANEQVFRHLSTIVPQSHCAIDYFEKKQHKMLTALRAMDEYTSSKKKLQGLPAADVAWCARIIETSVEKIVSRVNEAPSPLSASAKESAAKALSKILTELCERNVDVYNRGIWRHAKEQALDIKDRNIFVRFFDYGPEHGKKFILDDLSDLGDSATPYRELLKEAAEAFDSAYRNKKIPKAYVDKVQRIVGDLKGSGRGTRSKTGSKRPGDESGGDNKRMK